MKSRNIIKIKDKTTMLDEKLSEYYDNETNISEMIEFEARMAMSDELRNYYYENLFKNFCISNSIKLTSLRAKEYSNSLVKRIYESLEYENKTLFFNIYSVFLKNINKVLCSCMLYIRRNNPK